MPTADCQVLDRGLGFVTDLGMTGPARSVLGMKHEQAVNRFLGGLPMRFEPAPGPCKLEAVLFLSLIHISPAEYAVVHVEDWIREDDSLPEGL